MLLEELVEQHRVDLLVAHRFRLAHGIAPHQIRIYLGHFLSDQSKGDRLRRIILFVVTEADWFERVDRFAGFVHRLDIVFIPARRYVGAAESAAAVYGNVIGVGSHNRLHVRVDLADVASVAHVRSIDTDTNNVISRGDADAGCKTHGNIAAAGGVVFEREHTVGRVAGASRALEKRIDTVGSVAVADGVVKKCKLSIGRVVGAAGVAQKRPSTGGRILVSSVQEKGASADARVIVAGDVESQ